MKDRRYTDVAARSVPLHAPYATIVLAHAGRQGALRRVYGSADWQKKPVAAAKLSLLWAVELTMRPAELTQLLFSPVLPAIHTNLAAP